MLSLKPDGSGCVRALLLALLWHLGSSEMFSQGPNRVLDPPADLPSSKELELSRIRTGPRAGDTMGFRRRLSGYRVGDPLHSGSARFVEDLADDLRRLALSPQGQLRVIITGAADGIPNRGVTPLLDGLPMECQHAVTLPIDDGELALLRACVVREQLANLIGVESVDVAWERRMVDQPDGGNAGGPYRYVEVQVQR